MESELLGTIALVTSIVVMATAIVAFMTKLRKDITEIHFLVNQRMEEALQRITEQDKRQILAVARIDQLIDVLNDASIEIPINHGQPSIDRIL